jgi:hypothetical protein
MLMQEQFGGGQLDMYSSYTAINAFVKLNNAQISASYRTNF